MMDATDCMIDVHYALTIRRLRRPVTMMPCTTRWHKKYVHAQRKRGEGFLRKPRLVPVFSDHDNDLPF